MISVSVIIPARNEKYLQKTIETVLAAAEGAIEVIVMLDGYLPDPPINTGDSRVIFVHNQEAIGQRQSVNAGARMAKGKYIMKLDAHCSVDKGFDVKLAADCEYDWTVIPRMYNLDVDTWQPKLHKRTDYMYIGQSEGRMLRAEYYNHGQPDNDKPIDDTMCNMGPCFFMHKDRYWELGGMDENHGSWGQMGVETSLKAWLSGGSLKVNKKTWFAHWFRGGGGPGFPYPISGKSVEKARQYSRDLWMNDKWPQQKRNFAWVVNKFNPPGWPRPYLDENTITDLNKTLYWHVHKAKRYPKWRGHDVLKYPNDLILYQQVIQEKKPDFIIETGTKHGGSTIFLADMCDLAGGGKVISIDIAALSTPEHPRITYIKGSSIDKDLIAQVKAMIGSGTCMVILDSNHTRYHVKWELHRYKNLVTPGQYMVVEDCYSSNGILTGPGEARDWFLSATKGFVLDPLDKQFLICQTRDGWLRKT